MEALLHHSLTSREVGAVSALGLAHMGDAVYEILVRSMLVLDGHTTSGHLHKDTTAYVCAPAQAAAADLLLPHLCEEESGYYRRGRNAAVRDEDPGLMLISRRPPQQKYTSFEEYMDAHGGATAPIEDHSEEV